LTKRVRRTVRFRTVDRAHHRFCDFIHRGLAVVAWFMNWARQRGFTPFAIYGIVVGNCGIGVGDESPIASIRRIINKANQGVIDLPAQSLVVRPTASAT